MSIPEEGQLVSIRKGNYIVSNKKPSTLKPDLTHPFLKPQHLITLQSIDDDSTGEELKVIWEVEPGSHIYEDMPLPEPAGFDDPAVLDAFLNAVLWGAISSTDEKTFRSPFQSGVVIEGYQLDPLLRAIKMPRANLLIADDVGLGKTIETGLIIQELILRHRARTVLILCPSSLQIQWKDQMRDKFGLEFRIIDSIFLKELRRSQGIHCNPWSHFPRLITSIDYIKRERPLSLLKELLPPGGKTVYPRPFDILVIDEAHGVAPSGKGKYSTDSLRTQVIRTIAPHFEHRLFLTATPHNGYQESFTALLELLDNQRFTRRVNPSKEQLHSIMIRRLKSDLKKPDGTPLFPQRKLEAIEVSYSEKENELYSLLKEYTDLLIHSLKNSEEKTKVEEFATKFVLITLKKRLLSSPQAFLNTLEQHKNSIKRKSVIKTQISEKNVMNILRRHIEKLEEEFADDEIYEEEVEKTVDSTTSFLHKLSPEEKKLVSEMTLIAENLVKKPDSKASELIQWLHKHIRPGGKWSDERVIIFTEYRATQKWLNQLLAFEKFTEKDRLMTLYGGMNSDDRESIKAAFQADPSISPVRILLATDAASEGIDLQNHCARLIHYEIPWNPNRMEQRNGRIDRHGQKGIPDDPGNPSVFIYHFAGKGYKNKELSLTLSSALEGDLEFLMKASYKIQNIREDLGKVGPVLAHQVEEVMLGLRKDINTEEAEKQAKPGGNLLKIEKDINKQIDKLMESLSEAKETLNLSPENIESVVHTGLKMADLPGLIPCKLPGNNGEGKVYKIPELKASWRKCLDGLAHPHTGKIRPITFDEKIVSQRDDVVFAHMNHHLVQQCLRLLRAEIWASDKNKTLYRVTSRIVPDVILEFPAVIAYARLIVTGGDFQKLHEEIITAGGYWKKNNFYQLKAGHIRNILKSEKNTLPPGDINMELAKDWDKYKDSLRDSLTSAMNRREESLKKQLSERGDKEVEKMKAILEELEKGIRNELKAAEAPEQLELFDNEEKEQYRQDLNALEKRLKEIPEEIEKETEQIKKRFSDPQIRMFPLAITYLVPEKYLTGI